MRFLHLSKVAIALLFFPLVSFAAWIPVGSGGYTTDLPAGQKGPSDVYGNAVKPTVTSRFSQVPLTNQWWSSLIWKTNAENRWSEGLFPYPFSAQARSTGLVLGYSTRYSISPYATNSFGVKLHEYHYDPGQDLTIGVKGLTSPDTQVESYTDFTVTASWTGNGRQLLGTLGEGLPFAYFKAMGDLATVSFNSPPKIWFQKGEVLGVTLNGHSYGLFAPAGSSWKVTSTGVESDLNGKNYFSVSVLPEESLRVLEFFRRHAYAFVTDTRVDWTYDSSSSRLNSKYSIKTVLMESGDGNNVNQALVALFRHQWVNTVLPLTRFSYQTPRGLMRLAEGSEFTTDVVFHGILPAMPNTAQDGVDTYSASKLYQYVDTIFKQPELTRWNGIQVGDTYWTGKAMLRISNLIQIANQVKHFEARNLFLTELKTRLQDWFDGRSSHLFYYDSVWKTLIGYPASYGSDTMLNDHHFHYGYFLQAAATVAQFERSWVNQYGGMVELLIKDIYNWDRTDSRFPFLRGFDIYAGHGWANGPSLFGAGNNQESSSEAMNASAGLILWGSATGNAVLRDLGIFLYTTEAETIRQYWFDVDRQVFPKNFPEPALGMVWGNGGAYSIWWDGSIQELYGINFLPVTAGSLYLGMYPEYLKRSQSFMMASGVARPDIWRDIHMSVKALYDPISAIQEFNANSTYTPEAGESNAHTYHWIHNLNTLGRIEPLVTANTPLYAVFNKDGRRSYVVYNSEGKEVEVIFSDGVRVNAPANSFGYLKTLAVDSTQDLVNWLKRIFVRGEPKGRFQ